MDHKWLAHVSKDPIKKDEFKGVVLASKPVLDRLIEILTKDLQASMKEQKKVLPICITALAMQMRF